MPNRQLKGRGLVVKGTHRTEGQQIRRGARPGKHGPGQEERGQTGIPGLDNAALVHDTMQVVHAPVMAFWRTTTAKSQCALPSC